MPIELIEKPAAEAEAPAYTHIALFQFAEPIAVGPQTVLPNFSVKLTTEEAADLEAALTDGLKRWRKAEPNGSVRYIDLSRMVWVDIALAEVVEEHARKKSLIVPPPGTRLA